MELAGLAFHLSWLFLFLYSQSPAGCEDIVEESGEYLSPLYLFSSVALIVTLLAFVAAGRHSEDVLRRRSATITAMALTCIGTVIYYGAAFAVPDALGSAAPISGILTGVGSGFLAMRWAWGFEGVSSAIIMASTPSILAVTAVCCVTVPHLPAPCAALLVSALPLGSGVFALRLAPSAQSSAAFKESGQARGDGIPEGGAESRSGAADAHHQTAQPASRPRPLVFYLLLCGGIALLGLTLGITGRSAAPLFSLNSVTIFLGSAAGAVFIGSALVIRRTPEASFSANLLVPVVVIASFLIILASTQPNRIAQNFEAVGSLCLEMLFFAVLVIAARRFSMRAVTAFAAGRVTYALSNMAGSWLTGLYTAGATTDAVVQLSSFALLMGIEVIMVAAVVVVVLPQKRTAANSSERKAPDNEREASKTDATARAPFQQRAAEFAQRYQLTAREEEVAKQMLMGHSYSRIMQELCIAEGTVNYHARNIYAKAGVHSKQELVELFESEQ